jgi:hypothetical protein
MKKVAILSAAAMIAMAPTHARAAKSPALDPSSAYILVEVATLDDAMLKGTKMPGMLTLARYDAAKGDVRGGDLSPETALPKGQSPRVTINAKPIAKSKASRLYLVKLEPDTWVIEGANGTAFSLGSARFSIEPGQVIDLGVIKPVVEWLEGEGPKSMAGGMMGAMLFGSVKPKEIRPIRLDWRPRASSDFPIPASLSGRTISVGQFTYGAKFGNYLGGMINRIDGRAGRDKPAAASPDGIAKAQAAEGSGSVSAP